MKVHSVSNLQIKSEDYITVTKKMLMELFPDKRPERKERLVKQYGNECVSFAIKEGYLWECYDRQNNEMMCYITTKGEQLRNG